MTFTSALVSSLLLLGATTRDRRDRRDQAEARDAPLLTTLRVLPQISGAITAAGILQGTKAEMPTVTRSSAKLCTRSDGVLVSLGVNVPCVELRGLFVEQGSTNGHMYSEDLSSWNLRGTCVVTPGIDAPDGTMHAFRVSGVQEFAAGDLYASGSGQSGASIAVSFWMRQVSTSGVIEIQHSNGAGSPKWYVDLALIPTTWTRITASHPAVTVVVPFGTNIGGLNLFRHTGASPLSFDLWGVMEEVGTFVTSYIPTTGTAASRAADRVLFSSSLVPVQQGSMAVDFTLAFVPPDNSYVLNTQSQSGTSGTSLMLTSNGRIRFDTNNAAGTNQQLDDVPNLTWVKEGTYRLRLKWSGGNKWTYRDGVFQTSATGAVMPDVANQLNVGTAYNGNAGYNGWFKNLCLSRSTEGCQ